MKVFGKALIGVFVSSSLAWAADKSIALINPEIEVNSQGEISVKSNTGGYNLNNSKGTISGVGQSPLSPGGYYLEVERSNHFIERIRELQPTFTGITPAPWKGSIDRGYLVNVQAFKDGKLKTLVSCNGSIRQKSFFMNTVDSPIKKKDMTCFPVNKEVCEGFLKGFKGLYRVDSGFFKELGIHSVSDLAKNAQACTKFFVLSNFVFDDVEMTNQKHKAQFDAEIRDAKTFFLSKTKAGYFDWNQATIKTANHKSFVDAFTGASRASDTIMTYSELCGNFFPPGGGSIVHDGSDEKSSVTSAP